MKFKLINSILDAAIKADQLSVVAGIYFSTDSSLQLMARKRMP
ncbi:MAG: hypothetical protein DID90_2727554604 [Candidatus Nitrotoga sp. LAW]|nr:MAG: hypothetical protein DID90_2727554604 [Candidatus Nitrotoga sp. LAW]